MKFNYTKTINEKEYPASFNMDVIWHVIYVTDEEDGKITSVICHTNLIPVETYVRRPELNKKGEIVEWRDKKVTENPYVEITKEDEIQEFIKAWGKN